MIKKEHEEEKGPNSAAEEDWRLVVKVEDSPLDSVQIASVSLEQEDGDMLAEATSGKSGDSCVLNSPYGPQIARIVSDGLCGKIILNNLIVQETWKGVLFFFLRA